MRTRRSGRVEATAAPVGSSAAPLRPRPPQTAPDDSASLAHAHHVRAGEPVLQGSTQGRSLVLVAGRSQRRYHSGITSRMSRQQRRVRTRGQSLAEFGLVFPFFMVILFGVIEFAFALNASLSIDYATRDAALVAAEAGNTVGADCSILAKVDESVTAPADRGAITEVQIYKLTRTARSWARSTSIRAAAGRPAPASRTRSSARATPTSIAATPWPAARRRARRPSTRSASR